MSCTDVQTIQAGNGTKTQFSFDFPYIFKSEIHVYFWNATTKEYDEKLTTDGTYPWRITDANPTIVEFTSTAPPAPATPVDPGEPTVDNVKIRRITQIDDIRALFNPGSAIRSDDLNNNFEQLKYAIQESNCPGIPDDVDQYLKDYYWDRYDNTLYASDTWVSNDTKIATTAALDARFQDEVNDTFTKSELAAASNVMPDNDDAVPTTGALKNFTDHVIENDILVDSTGLNKTTTGGQVTIGISANSVDFDRIKSADKVQLADQEADYDLTGGDTKVFTASAAIRRFENYVQNSTPSGTGVGKGAVWVDIADDKTLSVWDGTAWQPIASGGTFTEQPKVVYVDVNGSDSNDGHRISRPKRTIKAAINQINADSTYGDGSTVIVAAGVYQEAAPIQIQKKNVSIIGQALRSCVVHPTVASQGDQSGGNHALFELNSGSFIQNLTLTGMKANNSGTNTLDSTLPSNQGWNFAFYSGATIYKSPYIQNCTNFSDSEIDNSDLNAEQPAGGLAGDTDSAPTGGGMLVDGAVLNSASPLRSMVADSYTHVGLNGPGILVVNNGYTQITSSYAFFNKYHIKCLNGGQANLAASTTDFGDQGLVADGKSTSAIFTSNVDGAASSGAISFNINEPTAGTGWFGTAERPGTNMLVEVNSVIYPILSATARTDSEGNDGWTVTISRPNSSNRSENLGLNGAIGDNAAVSFYLRSMIASSGHTMEYVGSGTDYRALPENGGVPDESKQKIELNNGKIWTAVTDHNGKFTVGGNQTDDPFFEVDQQLGFVTIPEGSIAFNLLSDLTPQLGGNLDVNGKQIVSASNGHIVINPNGSGNVGIGTTSPNAKLHVAGAASIGGSQQLRFYNSDTSALCWIQAESTSGGTNPAMRFGTSNSERMRIDNSGDVGIGTDSPESRLHVDGGSLTVGNNTGNSIKLRTRVGNANSSTFRFEKSRGGSSGPTDITQSDSLGAINWYGYSTGDYREGASITAQNAGTPSATSMPTVLYFKTTPVGSTSATNRMIINEDGNVGIGTTSPSGKLEVRAPSTTQTLNLVATENSTDAGGSIHFYAANRSDTGESAAYIKSLLVSNNGGSGNTQTGNLAFGTASTERMRINNSGNVGIGTNNPERKLHIVKAGTTAYPSDSNASLMVANSNHAIIQLSSPNTASARILFGDPEDADAGRITYDHSVNALLIQTNAAERLRIDSSGNVGIGTSSPALPLEVSGSISSQELYVTSDGDTTTNGISGGFRHGGVNSKSLVIEADPNNVGGSTAMRFEVDGTERMRIDSSGNVGIGTSSPLDKLQVAASGASSIVLANETTNTDGINRGRITKQADDSFEIRATDSANPAPLIFSSDVNNEFARFDTSRRLLIGATSSNAYPNFNGTTVNPLLQITGNTDSEVGILLRYNSGGAGNNRGSTLCFQRYTDGTAVSNNKNLGEITWQGEHNGDTSNTIAAASIRAHVDGTSGTNDMPGRLVFSTTADGGSSPTERMRINSSGNVGIGTSNPFNKLVVQGSGDATNTSVTVSEFTSTIRTDNAYLNIGSVDGYPCLQSSGTGTAYHMLLNPFNGRVGIGISSGSPNSKLHVESATGAGWQIRTDSVGLSNESGFYRDANDHYELVLRNGAGGLSFLKNDGGASSANLIFNVQGSERMRVDSSGRLLVGTTSVITGTSGYNNGTLQVSNTSSTQGGKSGLVAFAWDSGTGPNDAAILQFNKSKSDTQGTHTIVTDNNTLGTLMFSGSDGTNFQQAARIEGEVDGTPGTNDMPGRLVFSTTADGASAPTERMRIQSNGKILFGTTVATNTSNSGITLVPSTNGRMLLDIGTTNTASAQLQRFFNGNGQVGDISTSGTATAYNTSSDYRLKENIVPVADGITRLQQLKPSRFNFIADPNKIVDGFIAHEVQSIVPEAITGEKDAVDENGNPEYQGIDQSKLVPLLTAALQEALAKIDDLEARLAAAGL